MEANWLMISCRLTATSMLAASAVVVVFVEGRRLWKHVSHALKNLLSLPELLSDVSQQWVVE